MSTISFITKLRTIIKDGILHEEEISVARLAQKMNLHPSQLYRKTKAVTEASPSVLIRQIRLEESTILLRTTDQDIKFIAFRVGFGSNSYFCACFKAHFGCTPKEYREHAI